MDLVTSAACTITAVIVLYRRSPAESQALKTLLGALEEDGALATRFSVVLYDNSPLDQSAKLPHFPLTYHHDTRNSGLAAAYNFALTRAEDAGSPWLLLLDQDTSLTSAFLQELAPLAQDLLPSAEIIAMAPRLFSRGTMYSPESHFFYQLHHLFPHRSHALPPDTEGPQTAPVGVFNSGATLRVAALRAIGGFPSEFWLDYLDHAVFHALQQGRGRIYIMRAALEQQLAHTDLNAVPLWRHRNVLAAQTLFVKRFGRFGERVRYRLLLLHLARLAFRQCREWRVWSEMVIQAVLLRSRPLRIPGQYTD